MKGLAARVVGRGRVVRSSVGRVGWRLLDLGAGSRRQLDPDPSAGTLRVALTFDDGPHPGTTDRVLDLLAEVGAQATFFCVGRNAETHPDLLRRIAAEGHAVGSHSWSHPDPQRTPLRTLAADYRRGQQAVSEVLGTNTDLFRPPRGYLDLVRAVQLRRLQLRPCLWNVDPQDWHPDAISVAIEAQVAGAPDRAVVLLHDWIEQPWAPSVLDRGPTLGALPGALRALAQRGAVFVTLAEPH